MSAKETKKKAKTDSICVICVDNITDSKHEFNHCDGSCSTWLHHCCVDVSREELASLSKKDDLLFSPQCRFNQAEEIPSLKLQIQSLLSTIYSLQSAIHNSSDESSTTNSQAENQTSANSYFSITTGKRSSVIQQHIAPKTKQLHLLESYNLELA